SASPSTGSTADALPRGDGRRPPARPRPRRRRRPEGARAGDLPGPSARRPVGAPVARRGALLERQRLRRRLAGRAARPSQRPAAAPLHGQPRHSARSPRLGDRARAQELSMSNRTAELAGGLLRHIHAAIASSDLTYEEFGALKQWLIDVGEAGEWSL